LQVAAGLVYTRKLCQEVPPFFSVLLTSKIDAITINKKASYHIHSPISLYYTPQVSKATCSHFLVEKQTSVATPMMTRFLVPKQCNFTSKEVRLKAPIL